MLKKENFIPAALPIRKNKLNVLPVNSEIDSDNSKAVGPGRFPSWLHRPLPKGNLVKATGDLIQSQRLHTVCEEAKCPNLLECWSKKTATFLAMGKECTRSCGFCDIDFSKRPKALDDEEPQRIAHSVIALGLKHVVITMVARDDLEDGGAAHLANIVAAIKKASSEVTIELLTSDLEGKEESLDIVLASEPEIFNHNIETVRDLTKRVRHKASYERTLAVLSYVKKKAPSHLMVKSGIMVGLGETFDQVKETINDLKSVGCDIITIGQYLQASSSKLRVKEFVPPEIFKQYEAYGYEIGVAYMYCGPFIRSSYNANLVINEAGKRRTINSD